MTDETIEMMVAHGTALVPTLINIATFPGIADSATRYPIYAAHMRDLHSRRHRTIGAAHEAGIPIYAGTDAGGSILHGSPTRWLNSRSPGCRHTTRSVQPAGTPGPGWVDPDWSRVRPLTWWYSTKIRGETPLCWRSPPTWCFAAM